MRKTIFALLSMVGVSLCGSLLALELNTADRSSLESIKGLGPKKAALIISERDRNGPYKNAQDFADRVKGIGAKSVEKMQTNGLTINGSSSGVVVDNAKASKPTKTAAKKVKKVKETAPEQMATQPTAQPTATEAVTKAVVDQATATATQKSNALIDKALNKAAGKAAEAIGVAP